MYLDKAAVHLPVGRGPLHDHRDDFLRDRLHRAALRVRRVRQQPRLRC